MGNELCPHRVTKLNRADSTQKGIQTMSAGAGRAKLIQRFLQSTKQVFRRVEQKLIF